MTQPHDEDWRAIVENFGETPDADRIAAEVAPTSPPLADFVSDADDAPEWTGTSWADEGRYVPPNPPAPPELPLPQKIAWVLLLGGPAVLLVSLFVGFKPPAWLTLAIVLATVGSFVYLIFWAPRTPLEPWEDGAQI